MGEQGKPASALYSAFLSYSHSDAASAAWLQRAIEGYRFPKRIAQATGIDRLKPVFRDRGDLAAASDLNEAVRDALAASDWLIVVCSPASARSDWVGREIAFFRAHHGGSHILAALVSGDERDAFHPELRGPDGVAEPLAADFRPNGDGKRHGVLKLAAAMAGLRLDELIRRDAQRRIGRIRSGAIAATLATAGVAGLSVAAINARAAAQAERARAADNVQYQLHVVRSKLQAAGRLDLLAEQNRGIERSLDGCRHLDHMNSSERLLCAEFFQAQGSDDVDAGKLRSAKTKFVHAYAITRDEVREHPNEQKNIFAHAQSEYYIGFIAWQMRDLAVARLGFERYARLANQLAAIDPNNLDWRLEVAYARSNLGSLLLRETDNLALARGNFLAAQNAFTAVSLERPSDGDLRYEIADGLSWLGNIERRLGHYDMAFRYHARQRQIITDLLSHDPRNAKYKGALLVALIGIARVNGDRGLREHALAELRRAYSLASELNQSDPENDAVAEQKRSIELYINRYRS